MKIQNILSERFDDDNDYDPPELKRGYYHGDLEESEEKVTVGNFLVKFTVYQETTHSPTRYSRESPPESEVYVGDVKRVRIDSVSVPSQNFDAPDLDFEMDYPMDKNDVMEFNNLMQSLGDEYSGEDQEKYNRLIGYTFHNNPDMAKQILSAIDQVADNIYKGEI